MEKKILGSTGIEVSKICFGSLTLGPLQKNFSPKEGGKVVSYAIENGINFIDTAQLYKTYGHVYEGIRHFRREDLVIASKSYAYDEKTALESVYEALDELHTDYIDIFMLHEQESIHTIRGHYEALETYIKLKEKGVIRAVGLSTHAIAGVEAAIQYPEIEVIHPILNVSGLGIIDGTRDEMHEKIKIFHQDRGVFSMKPLGGGNLLNRIDESFEFVLGLDCIDSFAIGMQSFDEVDYNVRRVSDNKIDVELKERLKRQPRKLIIADWCVNCGACIKRCQQKALLPGSDKPIIDRSKCVTCGYCASVCKDFCIKVV